MVFFLDKTDFYFNVKKINYERSFFIPDVFFFIAKTFHQYFLVLKIMSYESFKTISFYPAGRYYNSTKDKESDVIKIRQKCSLVQNINTKKEINAC